MKKIVFFIIAALILFACGVPSTAAINTAIARTQEATNALGTVVAQTIAAMPTPTPVPFSSMNLENLLVQEGDLPSGFYGSEIRKPKNEIPSDAPVPDYSVLQAFLNINNPSNNNVGGSVIVFLYEDTSNIELAYQSISKSMIKDNLTNASVGEEGLVSSVNFYLFITSDLAFIRCHAAVHVQFIGISDKQYIIAYGNRLDERLKDIACR